MELQTQDDFGSLEVTLVENPYDPELDHEMMEYFRTKGKAMKNGDGDFIKEEDGNNTRTRGNKKGIFLAFVDGDEKVCIGYSMLHKSDRFDYRQSVKIEGWGRYLAYMKAIKHRDHSAYLMSKDSNARLAPKTIVKIPHSMFGSFAHFVIRCQHYYQDKTLPEWATSLANQIYKEEPKLPE